VWLTFTTSRYKVGRWDKQSLSWTASWNGTESWLARPMPRDGGGPADMCSAALDCIASACCSSSCCSGDAPGTQRRDTAGPQLAGLLCESESVQNELEHGPASVMRSFRSQRIQFSCVCGVERPLTLSRRGRQHATSPYRMRPNIRQC
jgi:hypothetical protein